MAPTASTMDPFRLDGEVALVTGASGGLGAPIVRALSAAGATVVVHHLGEDPRERAVIHELSAAGHSSLSVQGDITDDAAVRAMFHEITEKFGRCSILVNNAGMMEQARFVDMTLQQWNRTIAADLTGPMLVSQQFARQPVASGSIINVSSQLAFKGARDFVSYSAAKAGVIGLTRAMARELGPSIRVNAIAPGPVVTPLIEDLVLDPDWVAERTRGSVTAALATPEEVAPSVVFLTSPAAALLHGQTLHLNGGGIMA